MAERRAIIDTSSLILLHGCAFLTPLLEHYDTVIAGAVYAELAVPGKRGMTELVELVGGMVVASGGTEAGNGLGRGESACIGLYRAGRGDFLVLDDRRAAKVCQAEDIPFVDSLLMPRIFACAGLIDCLLCRLLVERLVRFGYYSPRIIALAEHMPAERLADFLPRGRRGSVSIS